MSVRAAVEEALAGVSDWRAEMARRLASEVDERGSASAAAQLRAVMAVIEDKGAEAGDELDEFRRARAARPAG